MYVLILQGYAALFEERAALVIVRHRKARAKTGALDGGGGAGVLARVVHAEAFEHAGEERAVEGIAAAVGVLDLDLVAVVAAHAACVKDDAALAALRDDDDLRLVEEHQLVGGGLGGQIPRTGSGR